MTAKKSAPKSVGVSPETYNEFIRQIELSNIYLIQSTIVRDRMPTMQVDVPLKFTIDRKALKFEILEDGFISKIKLDINLLDEESDKPFATIKTVWAAIYISKQEITREIYEVFKERNVPVNIWPYFREYVYSTISRMHLPQLTLPVFRP